MKPLRNESGQLMLISLLVLIVLGLSIWTVVSLNQNNTRFGLAAQNRSRALGTAQEGLAYAQHILAISTNTWQSALAGNFPAEFTDPTGPHPYADSAGGLFTIQCSTGGTAQIYQVQVVVRAGALDKATNQPVYNRAVQALFSQKTLSVALPTETLAGAALVMGQVPQVAPSNGLLLDWGPAISYDTAPWTLSGTIDSQQEPRKFSVGNITGSSFLRSMDPANPNSTDQKEYWANSSLGFPAVLDLTTYQFLAANTFSVVGATCTVSGNCTASPPGSGYFPTVGTDTAVFQGGWSPPASNAVIYINGNAEFKDIAVDLKNTGAFIILGNLILDNPLLQGIPGASLRVPNTVIADYPYHSSVIPCGAQIGQTCSVSQATNGATNQLPYRGFLYVKGNIIIQGNYNWVLDGVVRVDGQIQISNGSLHVFYDDQINRSILVTPMDLMIESLVTVPAS